jgi:hypothetical protein
VAREVSAGLRAAGRGAYTARYVCSGNNSGEKRMTRAIRSVVGAAAVLVGGALLAQPKDAGTDNYFPLKAKSKWVYKVGDNEVTVQVAKVDKEMFQLDTLVGKDPKTSEWCVVKADGVYRTQVKDDKIDPPVKVLPLPVKKDASWDINSKLGAQSIKGTMKIKSVSEKLTIGTATFENVVLVEGENLDVSGAKTTVRVWFAKDKGIVKEEFVLQGGEKVTIELKEYSEK